MKGPSLGLFPKCEFIWLDHSRLSPCPLRSGSSPSSLPATPLSDLSILGVPLGTPDLISPFVAQKLLDNLIPLLEKLVAFETLRPLPFAFYAYHPPFSLAFNRHFLRLFNSPSL